MSLSLCVPKSNGCAAPLGGGATFEVVRMPKNNPYWVHSQHIQGKYYETTSGGLWHSNQTKHLKANTPTVYYLLRNVKKYEVRFKSKKIEDGKFSINWRVEDPTRFNWQMLIQTSGEKRQERINTWRSCWGFQKTTKLSQPIHWPVGLWGGRRSKQLKLFNGRKVLLGP